MPIFDHTIFQETGGSIATVLQYDYRWLSGDCAGVLCAHLADDDATHQHSLHKMEGRGDFSMLFFFTLESAAVPSSDEAMKEPAVGSISEPSWSVHHELLPSLATARD